MPERKTKTAESTKVKKSKAKSYTTVTGMTSEEMQTTENQKSYLIKLRKTPLLILLLILLLIGVLYYFRRFFVVAIVNGQPIDRITFTRELDRESGQQTLKRLVTKTLILQEAKKENITVSQKEIDDQIRKIDENLKKQGKKLDEVLALQGLTRNTLIEQLRIQKMVEKMVDKGITITDKEVDDYIEKNKDSFPEGTNMEDVRKNVKDQLRQQKLSEKYQSWLDNLQKNAKIIYFQTF